MASGIYYGLCPYCFEDVWEDNYYFDETRGVDDEFVHLGCLKKADPLRFKTAKQVIDECFELGVFKRKGECK